MVGSDNYSKPQLKPEALKSLSAEGLLSLWATAEWQNLTKKTFKVILYTSYNNILPCSLLLRHAILYSFVCVCARVCMHLHMLVQTDIGYLPSVILHLIAWGRISHWVWGLLISLENKPQGCFYPYFPCRGIIVRCSQLLLYGCLGGNSGPHVCSINTLGTESSPRGIFAE